METTRTLVCLGFAPTEEECELLAKLHKEFMLSYGGQRGLSEDPQRVREFIDNAKGEIVYLRTDDPVRLVNLPVKKPYRLIVYITDPESDERTISRVLHFDPSAGTSEVWVMI